VFQLRRIMVKQIQPSKQERGGGGGIIGRTKQNICDLLSDSLLPHNKAKSKRSRLSARMNPNILFL
jgi:hypothetical protein